MKTNCGNRNYWDEWAKDVDQIAQNHISRITRIIRDPNNTQENKAFTEFAAELRDDLNGTITDAEVIEMLAQHLITRPIFDALFESYSFAANNPVSSAMQGVLDILQEHRLEKEANTLEKFYASVKMRAAGIDSAEGKQKIVVELYDKFFRNAFPRMSERLGIVYTPVEVVDFIIHSINDLLQQEFGRTLGCKDVHILDPFTGTGTFITRLLQSGLISQEQLPHKYKHEIHAHEIVLLAYYIAAINIEAVYHSLIGEKYKPFDGICLTDTFQLYEQEDLISNRPDIRVIMGNPPYSVGQTNANDNNQNSAYPELDQKIRDTYAEHSNATNKNALYDSYIRAIRWASDRVGDNGIIGYVTNAGFLEANTADGLRKCLAEEFSNIYVFHLRGNQRTSGERSRQEGGKIFGSGSRAPIAITLLVKNPNAQEHGQIYWHDIGDYLTQQQKLDIIREFKSVNGITEAKGWTKIQPDAHHDWVNQRDESFDAFIKIGDKKDKKAPVIFSDYSCGVKTNRDSWCYNASRTHLIDNMTKMIDIYNNETSRFHTMDRARREQTSINDFVNPDPTQISWTRELKKDLLRGHRRDFQEKDLRQSSYRPFQKIWSYFNRHFNNRIYKMPTLYPIPTTDNMVICLPGLGENKGFRPLISNTIPNLHFIAGSQCFPLYLYEKVENPNNDLFAAETQESYTRRDAITDDGLAHFQNAYPKSGDGNSIKKEDLFFYIYGLLHSPEYRNRYRDNLSKELPRIPAVKQFADFMAYSKAGRELAHWHLNYETANTCKTVKIDYGKNEPNYHVSKMKFAKRKDPATNKSVNDKSTVIYNAHITLRNIPLEAYDYIVNGKPAIEWVMERQAVITDKKSGITNDANLYATETMGNPKYPLELLLRVITVSLETNRIVSTLPKLDI